MRLLIFQMRWGVAINDIFSIKWIYYGPRGSILECWGTLIFVYYPIISHQSIKIYRAEIMNIDKISLTRWCQ